MSLRIPDLLTTALVALLLGAPATELVAQSDDERRSWTVSAMGGLFDWDSSDDTGPLFALRADRPTSDWFRLEFESSWARPDIPLVEDGTLDLEVPPGKTNIVTLTAGLQFRYQTEYVEPYVGIAAGFLWRRDDASDGVRTSQTTFQAPAGLRVFLTDRFGLRGEFRVRRDQTLIGLPDEWNFEQTVGVSYSF